jgi:predicted RNase H-like HicB family nuclease
MIKKPFTYTVKKIDGYWEGTVSQLPDVAVYEDTFEKAMETLEIVAEDCYNHYMEACMPKTKKWVWITFQKSGFHYYPSADESVGYLASKHRHLFKFKVQIEVFHNDRDVEFHGLLNFCEGLFEGKTLDIDFKSCEMLAQDLYDKLSERYSNRDIVIDVSEDGECGCSIEYRNNV